MLVAEVSRFGGPEVLTARQAADPAAGPGQVVIGTALRELGLGLEVVRAILSRAAPLAQVAAAHVAELDEQIRILRLRRAVPSTVAIRGNTIEETLVMHKLARPSAQERQQMTDDLVDGVFASADPQAPGTGIARRMRQLPAVPARRACLRVAHRCPVRRLEAVSRAAQWP